MSSKTHTTAVSTQHRQDIRQFYSEHKHTLQFLLVLITIRLLVRTELWTQHATRWGLGGWLDLLTTTRPSNTGGQSSAVFSSTEFDQQDPMHFNKATMGFWGLVLVLFVMALC